MSKKIAVYTICKNESKFVKRWIKSMWNGGEGANAAYILDTGSTDGTVELFHKTIEEMHIPQGWLMINSKEYADFRFDVARNDNLDMIPYDIYDVLVSVDLDEVFIPQFWGDLRALVVEHPDYSRINYLYAWNHDDNGNNGRVFWYGKVHPQKGYRYQGAVHEWCDNVEPEKYKYGAEYSLDANTVYLHHYADNTKSRGSYLPLLEVRVAEMPYDVNAYVYLVREYLFHNMYTQAYLMAHMALLIDNGSFSNWLKTELATLYQIFEKDKDAEMYYKSAIETDPTMRNAYVRYADFLVHNGRALEALETLAAMERKTYNHHTWMELDYDWTWRPQHITATALCWLGQYEDAYKLFKEIEDNYLITDKDKAEAKAYAFYDDFNWLKDRLKEMGGVSLE